MVQQAYKLDFINDMADSIGKSIQTLAGVTENGFSSSGFYVGFLLIIILIVGVYTAYTGLLKRETSKALHAVINFVVVFIVSASFIAYAPNYIQKINDFSSDISTASLDLGTKIMLPDSQSKGKDSVDLIRDSLFAIQVEKPWLLLQFGNSDTEEIGTDRVEALVSASPSDEDGETRENIVKTEIEDNDNDNLTIPQVVNRLGMVFFLLIFNLGITIFIFLLTGMMLFSQILFIIYAMFLPISFLMSMIPTYENMAKQAVVRVFNAIMTRAGITLIVTVAFSISSMFYNISTDYPFFMVAFLQIICFAGIYMKLGELMSMFSLNANDSQQIGRRIFRRPMVFIRHRARRMEHKIARAVGAGSVAGAVAGASVARAGKPATNQPPKKRENTSASMGSRVGSAVGAVMDTKNKVRDSASSLKENVKDLPTQAGYAVHSAKQKAKDNVSDFKRGVVEERENRQEQRTQKRNLHRENISQKKQELQEAKQDVHANGSATAGATRSHERPVATPVPKPAQTDTVTKPDIKRPATSPVIKNVEVKAGKETVRTNIRQEQQVKSVARTNQPNVAESRSNRKKKTLQKQVNQKQNRKSVTKQSEKGRKK